MSRRLLHRGLAGSGASRTISVERVSGPRSRLLCTSDTGLDHSVGSTQINISEYLPHLDIAEFVETGRAYLTSSLADRRQYEAGPGCDRLLEYPHHTMCSPVYLRLRERVRCASKIPSPHYSGSRVYMPFLLWVVTEHTGGDSP